MSELNEAKMHLQELEKFLDSVVHKGYTAARKSEIELLKNTILNLEPIDPGDVAEQFKLRGELRSQEEMLTTFEDARKTLKDRIDEMIERENELATATKV